MLLQNKNHKNLSLNGGALLRLFLIFGHIDYRQRSKKLSTIDCADESLIFMLQKMPDKQAH